MYEVSFIGIAHAIFTILFAVSKENRSISDNTLIAWIVCLAMPLVVRILSPDVLDIYVPIISHFLAYPLCFGPFLWLYVKCVTEDIKTYRLSHLWHFLPFIIAIFYQIIFKEITLHPDINLTLDTGISMDEFIVISNIISLCCYSGMVVWRLQKHTVEILFSFSSLPTKVTLRWLVWLTYGFIIAYMFPLFTSLSANYSHGYALTGFIFVLSYFGLKQTQIYNGQKYETSSIAIPNEDALEAKKDPSIEQSELTENKQIKGKYERSGLTLERSSYYLKRLDTYTQNEKPYLNANLTVYKLAKESHIPRHYLTQIFSEQLNKNFYTYINEYRINNVKQLLADPKNSNMTLIEMAFESGFNTKSTFNSVFKKITNMTPTQYKKYAEKL